jgi:hypothetical protein
MAVLGDLRNRRLVVELGTVRAAVRHTGLAVVDHGEAGRHTGLVVAGRHIGLEEVVLHIVLGAVLHTVLEAVLRIVLGAVHRTDQAVVAGIVQKGAHHNLAVVEERHTGLVEAHHIDLGVVVVHNPAEAGSHPVAEDTVDAALVVVVDSRVEEADRTLGVGLLQDISIRSAPGIPSIGGHAGCIMIVGL